MKMMQFTNVISLCFACGFGVFPLIESKLLKEKVFLLVFDGFVHDFQTITSNTPNFKKLSEQGVKGKGLIPPFPTVTWSCMATLTTGLYPCLLYTSPSPRDKRQSRMPSSA